MRRWLFEVLAVLLIGGSGEQVGDLLGRTRPDHNRQHRCLGQAALQERQLHLKGVLRLVRPVVLGGQLRQRQCARSGGVDGDRAERGAPP